MKPMANDYGMGGVEQMFYAGSVAYNTEDVDKGVELFKVPNKMIITRAVAVVNTAFNAGTTNVLVLGTGGTGGDDDALLAAADVTEGTAGTYSKQTFLECAKGTPIEAKYTQTGTDASAGQADIYLFFVAVAE